MKKNKYEKPVKLDMGFEEAMERLSKVPKSNVEKNIKNQRKKGS
jgi:hypothetical protein